jgi:hypothetical protein
MEHTKRHLVIAVIASASFLLLVAAFVKGVLAEPRRVADIWFVRDLAELERNAPNGEPLSENDDLYDKCAPPSRCYCVRPDIEAQNDSRRRDTPRPTMTCRMVRGLW